MDLAEAGRPAGEGFYAVVVPNMARMRERKIVNVGDLLRFELEGLSHGLPPHQRVHGYEISFDSLPRDPAHDIRRHEVERRVRDRYLASPQPDPALGAEHREWLNRPHVAAAMPLIQARAKGRWVRPDANLELDLGLDSIERVELLTELERRFATTITERAAAEILTVKQLIDAMLIDDPKGLPPRQRASERPQQSESWAAILRDLSGADDQRRGWLLRRRPFAAPILFVLARVIHMLFFRARVNGLDRLPASGPYIITPNHQSYVDPFVLCGVLPYRVFKELFVIVAPEYFETPFTRWVAHTANLVPVDPDSHLIPAMKASALGLSHNKILMLFPEGERSIDGTVKKFKKGAPILARHLQVPLVPVALHGIHELWPRNRGINWRLVAPWSGHRVTIEIGEPMTVAAGVGYTDGATALRERVNAMWQALSS